MDKGLVSALSFYKSSRYRQRILYCIGDKTLTPSEISRDVNIRINHVSMVLTALKNGGLVKCLNEKNKRGRLYELTELGRQVLAHECRNST